MIKADSPSMARDEASTAVNPESILHVGGDHQIGQSVSGNESVSTTSKSRDERNKNESPSTKETGMRFTPKDFIALKIIGEGSFSMVVKALLVKDRQKQYAVKVCAKDVIKKENKITAIFREKDVMKILIEHSSPFFITLVGTFHDDYNCYFVMTYAKNGELLDYMRNGLDDVSARFYSAEILRALEHLHSLGIIHRDLKPENILLNERMHIQITDFGCAMITNPKEVNPVKGELENEPSIPPEGTNDHASPSAFSRRLRRRTSFVGTAEYLAPEMLKSKDATNATDLWAFGVIIYQMTTGFFPFRDSDVTDVMTIQDRQVKEFRILKKIEKMDYSFPETFDPVAKDLVQSILKPDPRERLGVEGFDKNCDEKEPTKPGHRVYHEIRNHPYFESINGRWDTLHEEIPPLPPPPCDVEDLEEEVNHEIGFNFRTLARLTANGISESRNTRSVVPDMKDRFTQDRLSRQRQHNPFHKFVCDNLILHQGLLDKKKGLFARRRMFLLTTGPRLFYVDPSNMVLKGEVPWSANMRCEIKSFTVFHIHTPGRIYYLEDASKTPDVKGWVRCIEDVRDYYFNSPSRKASSHNNRANNLHSPELKGHVDTR